MYRVLVLTSTYPRWEGDTEPRFVLDLCRHMSEQHAEILVIAPHAPGAALQQEIDTVLVQRFRYFPANWQTLAYQGGIVAKLRESPWRIVQVPFFLLSFYRATRRAIRIFNPDLIHSHWLVPQGLIACLAVRGRCPVLCTSHGGDLLGLQTKPFRAMKSWILRNCCAVTVVSSSMVSHVRALAAQARIEVIPMGTELDALFTPPRSNTRRENELLFAGRLVHGKGVDKLLEALALLRSWKLDARLRIAGDGPLKAQLAAHASRLGLSSCIEFLGSVSHDELAGIYRRATLAVFPFESQQGFGLVITEAMACGCPVIASDLPATRQSVEDGVSGILTPPGDSTRLAEAIRKCLSNGELRSRLSNTALASVRQRFGWQAIATRYMQVIESCLR